MNNKIINLRHLKMGQNAIIKSVNINNELGRRIRDLGLLPNVKIKVIGRAPLKDPVALRLNEITLTLRNNEAEFISVEVNEEKGYLLIKGSVPGSKNGFVKISKAQKK